LQGEEAYKEPPQERAVFLFYIKSTSINKDAMTFTKTKTHSKDQNTLHKTFMHINKHSQTCTN